MLQTSLKVRVYNGFQDPGVSGENWNALLRQTPSNVIFLTHEWQKTWWESFGRGQLLLIGVEREGTLVALAPFFSDSGMIFFVGSGGSDYLDFMGDVKSPEILEALLETARNCVPDFLGFKFYHVPESSPTTDRLFQAANRLGWTHFDEGELGAPALELTSSQRADEVVRKKSLVRHETYFKRNGKLEVRHLTDGEEIFPHLAAFFEQHIQHWQNTPHPSLFQDEAQRLFYQRLTQSARDTGWLRFTRVDWEGRPIAFHFGFCHEGRFLWYKPSFDIQLARRSPGEVLLRQLFLRALHEGAEIFDFGLGDEAFKSRFATRVNRVRTWGIYPSKKEPS